MQAFSAIPPLLGLSLDCDRPFFTERSGGVAAEVGCSSDSLRYHRKHSATGVLLHLSRDRGGISVGSPSTKLHLAIHSRIVSEVMP